MNRKPNLIPAAALILLGLGLGAFGGFQLRNAPPRYQATAGVQVIRDQTDLDQLPAHMPAAASASVFLQNEAETVRTTRVLEKVIAQLDLQREFGTKLRGEGQSLSPRETEELLRQRVTAGPAAGSAMLQISATSETAANAQQLANAVAAAYCDYRSERRKQKSQAIVDLLSAPFHESDAKYQAALRQVANAQQALDPQLRQMNPPPRPDETEAAKSRQQLAQLTMVILTQSNLLARSKTFPAEEAQQIAEKFSNLTNQLSEVERSLRAEWLRQQALTDYWTAREEADRLDHLMEPLRKELAAQQAQTTTTNNPPAILAEPATDAEKMPASNPLAFGCLIGAVGCLLAGAWLLSPGRRATPPS